MIAPRRAGHGLPTPLDRVLWLAAGVVGLVALVEQTLPRIATELFDRDPAARVAGLMLATLSWGVFVSARSTATGLRRLLGRVASVGLAIGAAVRLAGPPAIEAIGTALPGRDLPAARWLTASGALALTATLAWALARRRRALSRAGR